MCDEKTKTEIWAMVQAMNDVWTTGNPEELSNYFHPNMVAVTPMNRHRIEGGVACIEGWKSFAKSAKIHYWKEINPIIHLYGNSAVVAYDYDMSFDMGGSTTQSSGRDLFFVVKENGKWWAVADQFSPYPC
ncbi:MAG: nuclear transport factor 2 family protein [Holophagaceae bacterium]|nr:nuclear transport factor 2 family protein [Holophagaceae bacterium]